MWFTFLGLFNGMMGLDPSMFGGGAAAGGGGEMDSDTMEKLSALASSMGSVNVMEDLQMRSKMLEELYSRAATTGGLSAESSTPSSTAAATTSQEPGERSSPSHTRHRKSATATITKPATSTVDATKSSDQPEDLSVKSKASTSGEAEGRSSSRLSSHAEPERAETPAAMTRITHEEESIPALDNDASKCDTPRCSEGGASRSEGRASRTSDHSTDRNTRNETPPPESGSPAENSDTSPAPSPPQKEES